MENHLQRSTKQNPKRLHISDDNDISVLYTRHSSNTWKGGPIDYGEWTALQFDSVRGFTSEDQDFYRTMFQAMTSQLRKLLSSSYYSDGSSNAHQGCMNKGKAFEQIISVDVNDIRGLYHD